jgi:hypothetical protein
VVDNCSEGRRVHESRADAEDRGSSKESVEGVGERGTDADKDAHAKDADEEAGDNDVAAANAVTEPAADKLGEFEGFI